MNDVHERMVYAVQFGPADSPVKIGSTCNIGARMATMSCDHFHEMRMLYRMPGGYAEEFALHRRFESLRVRGEWFRPDPVLLAFLEDCMHRELVGRLLDSVEWATLRNRADHLCARCTSCREDAVEDDELVEVYDPSGLLHRHEQ